MVISRRRGEAARSAASPLMAAIRRSENTAPHPITATSQTGPELSAREASRRPATHSAGLNPLISFMAFLALVVVINAMFKMLASPSDKGLSLPQPPLLAMLLRGGT